MNALEKEIAAFEAATKKKREQLEAKRQRRNDDILGEMLKIFKQSNERYYNELMAEAESAYDKRLADAAAKRAARRAAKREDTVEKTDSGEPFSLTPLASY